LVKKKYIYEEYTVGEQAVDKKKRRKRKKNNRLKYFFFSIVLCYLLIKLISIANSSSNPTDIVEYGSIQIIDHLECYVVRNEKRIHSNQEGEIKYFVREGEKVEKGYKVLEIHKGTVEESAKNRLSVLEQKIKALQENNVEWFQADAENLNKEINSLVENVKLSQIQGDLLKVAQLEKELKSKMEKKKIISEENSLEGNNLEDLKAEQEMLTKKISDNVSYITSPMSGIISYHVDGYESVLTPQNMVSMEKERLEKEKSELTDLRGANAIENQPLFKIVDDSIWYMITWVNDDILSHYKEGKNIFFRFSDDEQVEGRVNKIIENKDKNMIIFELDEYVSNFYNIRKINLDVIAVNYEGLKIYRDSIVEKDGQKGVYVLDVNRQTHFKPIQIIGYDDTYAIVKDTVFYEGEGENKKAISTIRLYDEVVRNAKNVKEGQTVY